MARKLTDFSAVAAAFRHRNYALYAAGNAVSLIGLWVQRVAAGYLAWQLTKSGFWLGAVAFADLFPVVVFGPFAGVLADRHNPQRIILTCQVLAMIQAIALFGLAASGAMTIEILFGLTLFLGVVISFHQPARLSFIPRLVPRADLGAAVAIGSVIFNGARFVGPAVAGGIITLFGVAPAFLFDAASYLVMIAMLLAIRIEPPARSAMARRGMLGEVRDGLVYTARSGAIGPLMLILIAICVLARPVFELLPGFADAVFDRGPAGLAMLTSSVGLGAITGGIWLAQRGRIEGLTRIAVVSGGIAGAAVVVFAATDWFPLALASMAVAGCSMVACGVGTQTLLQASVDEAMRGRVLALWGVVFRGGPAIGALAMGALSGPFGLGPPLLVGGILCIAWTALMLRRSGALARLLEGAPAG